MNAVRLLIVGDADRLLPTIRTEMEKQEITGVRAVSWGHALQVLSRVPVDVVILNMKTAKMDGIAVLQEIKQRYPLVEVILLAGHASVESAVASLKMGAFDYIARPCDASFIVRKVREACDRKRDAEDRLCRDRIARIARQPMAIFDRLGRD